MTFVKKTWKDRLVEHAGRRMLKRISGDPNETMVVDVTRSEGTVSQEGDAFSGANMNDLEQRIGDAFEEVNNNLGGCSLAQEGDDFYIVGADAVRKKLGSNELNFVAAFELNGVGSYNFAADKDYDVMYVFISKTYPASLNAVPSVGGATLIKSYSTRRSMDGISFGNISCIYELKNVLKGGNIPIYSNTAAQYTIASVIVLAS